MGGGGGGGGGGGSRSAVTAVISTGWAVVIASVIGSGRVIRSAGLNFRAAAVIGEGEVTARSTTTMGELGRAVKVDSEVGR